MGEVYARFVKLGGVLPLALDATLYWVSLGAAAGAVALFLWLMRERRRD